MKNGETKEIDHGEKRLRKILKKAKNKSVDTGVFENAGYHHSGVHMVAVAVINEFGGENAKTGQRIPKRSFIRWVANKKAKTIYKYIDRQSREIMAGRIDVDQALERIGSLVKKLMQRRIRSMKSPRNKAATVAIKGKNDPLVDSGALMRSLDTKVDNK